MLFAFYVHHLSPYLVEFGNGFGVRWYGLSYVTAFLVGILLYKNLARRGYSDLKPEAVADFIIAGAIFGVVLGGRLGYMLFYDLQGFLANPLTLFKIWEGGMSSHGGIGGLQTRPFILHPTELEVPPGPIIGAASVHGILLGWRRQLQGGSNGPAPASAGQAEPVEVA